MTRDCRKPRFQRTRNKLCIRVTLRADAFINPNKISYRPAINVWRFTVIINVLCSTPAERLLHLTKVGKTRVSSFRLFMRQIMLNFVRIRSSHIIQRYIPTLVYILAMFEATRSKSKRSITLMCNKILCTGLQV